MAHESQRHGLRADLQRALIGRWAAAWPEQKLKLHVGS
jgi:hypothetical protein